MTRLPALHSLTAADYAYKSCSRDIPSLLFRFQARHIAVCFALTRHDLQYLCDISESWN